MNLQFVTHAIGAARLALKAKAPTIMVVSGVTAMTAGTVVACKQTLKIDGILEEHVPELEKIEKGEDLLIPSYTPEDAQSDRIKVYTRVTVDMVKLYAVPATLFIGGACLVFGGHRIMLRREATLAIAFTGLKKAFDAYRGRVVDSFGSEADQAMMNGWRKREVIDDESGEVGIANSRDWDSNHDPYNRIFEQGATTAWKPDLGTNKMFISQQRRFAQERLNRRGYLYLSEVYESLGFPESDVSRVVGWKIRQHPDGSKDFPMVDFGLDKPHPDDWKYDAERAIYLDFNCQGLIVGGKLQRILERS